MKRHHAADLPASSGGEMHAGTGKAACKLDKGRSTSSCPRLCCLLVLCTTVSMLVIHCYDYGHADTGVEHGRSSSSSPLHGIRKMSSISAKPANNGDRIRGDLCAGRYVYVQELPPHFNSDMARDCEALSEWTEAGKCKHTANGGFGPPQPSSGVEETVLFQGQETGGWYDTEEHALDIIFHDRVKRYECLTADSSLASAVFVPFYAGLDVARHLPGKGRYHVATRDEMALAMVEFVTARPEWRALGGRDHFFVAGRGTWDFRRSQDDGGGWGNKLFLLPAVRNMTALVVEASPWHLNDAAVPYPTGFHPTTDEHVFLWQHRLRELKRQSLFAFFVSGAPQGTEEDPKSVSSHLVKQCAASSACSLVRDEDSSPAAAGIMKLYQSSTFCLHPRGGAGDAYTRRSIFDAILAGCIPVFFHPGTAYVQYTWHLPRDHARYSVYIPEEDVLRAGAGNNNASSSSSVEETLRKIPPDAVERMRAAVVELIPTVIYADTSSRLEASSVPDAFDVAVEAVIKKVTKLRKDLVEGRAEDEKLGKFGWKYPLLGEGHKVEDPHEWDSLFAYN